MDLATDEADIYMGFLNTSYGTGRFRLSLWILTIYVSSREWSEHRKARERNRKGNGEEDLVPLLETLDVAECEFHFTPSFSNITQMTKVHIFSSLPQLN